MKTNKNTDVFKTFYRKDYLFVFLLIVIGFLLYSYSFFGEFLHMDDVENVLNNSAVKNIGDAFSTYKIKTIVNSLLLNRFGGNPIPFHIVSVLLHTTNTVLVFYIVRLLFGKKHAFLSSLLFLIHPAASETVSWISGSVYLYQAVFWFLIIYFMVLFRKSSNKLYILLATVFYILYFLSVGRVWGLVLPFILLTLDIFILNNEYSFKKAYPIFLIASITLVYFIVSFKQDYSFRSQDLEFYYVGLTPENRVVSILRAVYNSTLLFVFPYRLSILFGNFDRTMLSYFGLLIAVGLILYFSYLIYKKNRKYFGLLLLIFVSALPVFSPISIGLGYAERYFYLSTAFFSILFVSLILDIQKKDVITPLIILVFLLFFVRTFIRTLDWKNDETIWKSTLAANPENNYKAYNELGNIYYRNDQLKEALINYEHALKIRPQYPEVLHNIGLTFIKAGQLENARTYMFRSLQLNPKMHESYYRLGQMAAYENDYESAKEYYIRALDFKPDFIPAQEELAKLP